MKIIYQNRIKHLRPKIGDAVVFRGGLKENEITESFKITTDYGYSSQENVNANVMRIRVSLNQVSKLDNSEVFGYLGEKNFAFKTEDKEKDAETLKTIINDVLLNTSMYLQDNFGVYFCKEEDTTDLIRRTIGSLDEGKLY